MPLTPPANPPPLGTELGTTSVSKFSGEPSGSIIGTGSSIFFSPALLQSNTGNELLLDTVSVALTVGDQYTFPYQDEDRVFEWGINSRTNNSLYRIQPKYYGITATLVQTMPPGPTTIIKIP